MEELVFDDWQERYLQQKNRILSATALLAGAVQKPPSLYQGGFLLERSITLIAGEPYAGKSLFGLAVSLSLAYGYKLFNAYEPLRSHRVLYVGQDSPSWDYAEQLRKLHAGYLLRLASPSGTTSDGHLDLLLNSGFQLTDPRQLHDLTEYIDFVGVDTLVFDTLKSIHNLDENSNRDMGGLLDLIKRLRDTHALTIFLIHHASKPSADAGRSAIYSARGASVISGSVDSQLNLASSVRGGTTGIRIAVSKGRGLPTAARKPLHVTLSDSDSVVQLDLSEPVREPVHLVRHSGAILGELRNGPATRSHLRGRTQLSDEDLDRALRHLKDTHQIESPVRGTYALLSE